MAGTHFVTQFTQVSRHFEFTVEKKMFRENIVKKVVDVSTKLLLEKVQELRKTKKLKR